MQDVHEIEIAAEEARRMVKRKDMALKLASNREFKVLVLEGYFKDEPVRLTSCLSNNISEEQRASIYKELEAIALFQSYLRTIVQMGNVAASELAEYDELAEEARAEQEGDE